MSKPKIIAFIVFLVFAAAGYYFFYGDAFAKKSIVISYTFRPRASAMARKGKTDNGQAVPLMNNVNFAFLNGPFRLTSIKLVLLDEYKTNKYCHPVWELVSSSNSVPTKAFTYGANIGGMHPAIKDARPDPLSNGVPYRLIAVAGKIRGERDIILNATNNVVQ
jgi:hypothetical protein